MDTSAASPIVKNRQRSLALIGIFVVVWGIFAALIHTASAQSVLGADYYTFWVAGRALFIDGVDPYSAAVTEQAQMGKLGRLAQPGEDQLAYAYPPYGLFVLLPTFFFPFDWAVSVWMAFNILTFLLILYLVLPPPARAVSVTCLVMFPVFLNLVLGTFDILLGIGVLLFYGWIVAQERRSRGIQYLTGFLLAWGTMKPQFIWLVLLFALIYALRERLFPFLAAFFVSLAGLAALSFVLVPGWVTEWIARVQEYAAYVQGHPTLADFLGLVIPMPSALIVTAAAFAVCAGVTVLLLVRWWQGRLHWLKVLAWLGMLTYLFHLHGISYEQLIFILPLILWIGQRGGVRSKAATFFWVATIIVSWVAFAAGTHSIALDRSPVLFNAVWVAWLFSKPRLQL